MTWIDTNLTSSLYLRFGIQISHTYKGTIRIFLVHKYLNRYNMIDISSLRFRLIYYREKLLLNIRPIGFIWFKEMKMVLRIEWILNTLRCLWKINYYHNEGLFYEIVFEPWIEVEVVHVENSPFVLDELILSGNSSSCSCMSWFPKTFIQALGIRLSIVEK